MHLKNEIRGGKDVKFETRVRQEGCSFCKKKHLAVFHISCQAAAHTVLGLK